LDNGSYLPIGAVIVEVPKDGLLSRPIAVMRPQDRVVYEALGDELVGPIDATLSESVYSFRLKPSQSHLGLRGLRPQIRSWTRFYEVARALHADNGYGFALTTDITSYFEYVDIEVLIKELAAVPGIGQSHLELLSKILNSLQRSTDIWGLPQGRTTSSILGNFYLLPLDTAISRQPVRFIRYSDDIKIFANGPSDLRLALRDLIGILRNRHLNLSFHKTRILAGTEILDEFEDSKKAAIDYGFDIGDTGTAAELTELFDRAVSKNPVDSRDVRFAIPRLAKLENPHAVPWILDHLPEVPYLASHLVEYLDVHMERMPEIEERVRSYLDDPKENIYPYSELHVIRMLARAKTLSDETRNSIWRILMDQNKDRFVREHAARCVGRHAALGDTALLKAYFRTTPSVSLRRALLVAIVESGPADAAWLGNVANDDPALAATCQYLRTARHLPSP